MDIVRVLNLENLYEFFNMWSTKFCTVLHLLHPVVLSTYLLLALINTQTLISLFSIITPNLRVKTPNLTSMQKFK